MKKELIILFFGLIMFLSLVSAKITISDINTIYNLGDRININTKIIPQSTDGNFEINLICGDKSVNLERMSAEARFMVNKEVSYSTVIRLLPDNINDLRGICFIRVSLPGDSASTKSFTISDKLNVVTKLDKERYNPGDEVTITIDIQKENGDLLDGFFISKGLLDLNKPFTRGKLIEKFKIPSDIESGNKEISFSVFDNLNGEVLNKYEGYFHLVVNSIPTNIQIAVSDNQIDPGKNLTFSTSLFDQSGKLMDEFLSVVIVSPKGDQKSREVKSGDMNYIEFPADAIPGIWKVKSKFSQVNEEIDFEVNKIGIIQPSFLDNILILKNIGNSPYTGSVEVIIGNEEREIELTNLKPGNEKRYELSGPEGEYSLKIMGEDSRQMFLTGELIGIKELNENGLIKKYSFVWGFILSLLFLLTCILLLRIRKTPFKLLDYFEMKKNTRKDNKTIQLSEDFSIKTKRKIIFAENSLVLKGEKQNSSVIVIKIEDSELLNNQTKEEISNILKVIDKKLGVIERRGDYSLVIFHPLVTKSFSNETDASEIAFDMYKKLTDLNKKLSKKIVFGIGLHNGELIGEVKGDILAYTSIGNTILLARKMADLRENKIYTSEDFRRKVIKELRIEKSIQISGIQIYNILNFSSKNNSAKLDDLLRRIHD